MTSRVLLTARRTAVAAVLSFGAVYFFGALSTGYDWGETCENVGERFDDSLEFDREDRFPLSLRCNESFDLVPAWINPVLVALLVVLSVSTAVVVVCEFRRGWSWWRTARRRRRDGMARAASGGWETGRR
jgi:hypothetical protein